MSTTDTRRASKARQPWQDELARLRWLEQKMTALAADLQQSAAGLRTTVTGAADEIRRDQLDAAAAEREQAAEDIAAIITASYAGPPSATDDDWFTWHLDELSHLAAVLRQACQCTLGGNVLDNAGGPE